MRCCCGRCPIRSRPPGGHLAAFAGHRHHRDWPSPGQYIDLQNENHSFEEMAMSQASSFTLTGLDSPSAWTACARHPACLHMLGPSRCWAACCCPKRTSPASRRWRSSATNLWKRLFSSDPRIVGTSITLNGKQFTVAGVLRPEFRLNSEVMPTGRPHGQGGHVPAAALGRRRGEPARGRELQHDGAAEAGRDLCSRRRRTWISSPAASGRRTSATAPSA